MARPDGRQLAQVFVLGVVAACGQAPLDWWFVALPAFAGMMAMILRAQGPRTAAWLGWLGGAGYFTAALAWIVSPFLIDPVVYGWMAPFALLGIGFGLALFWALAAGVSARLMRGALPLALALSLVELARGYVLTGFPWALPGHIWLETPIGPGAALLGANGLTLLTFLLAALPVMARWRGLAVAVLILVLAWGGGMWRLSQPLPAQRDAVLRLVQPNAEQHLKWDPDQAEQIFDRLLGMTSALPTPDLVIWPETALPYLLRPNEGAAVAISQAAAGVPVATGVQRDDGERAYNSLAVLGADGAVSALYDKHHLVPFGEYVPFGDLAYRWFGLRAFAAQSGFAYSAGEGAKVLDLGPQLGKALPLICYEAVFPQDLRAAPTRADWILQITNDAWFGTLTGPYQHAAQARFRAIEQGLPLVRVANTGLSFVTDARGQITAALDFGTAGHLDATLPGAFIATPYARFGDGPFALLLVGLALGLFAQRRRRAA